MNLHEFQIIVSDKNMADYLEKILKSKENMTNFDIVKTQLNKYLFDKYCSKKYLESCEPEFCSLKICDNCDYLKIVKLIFSQYQISLKVGEKYE